MADMTDVILAMALSDGGGGGGSVTGVVRYSVEQNLTDAQKQTAKSNIGAAGETALASVYDPNNTQIATGTTVFVPGQHFMYKSELYMAVENIEQGDEIEPGENAIVISVDELVLEKADDATFRDAIANQFSDSVDYKKGDYVWYNGVLCLFDRDHAAGEWDDDDVVTDAPITNYARDAGAVRYDGTQSLTADEKKRARLNIGAGWAGAITVTGTTPAFTEAGRYVCASVPTEVTINPLTNDEICVVFSTGTTPPVLNVSSSLKMPDWWTGLEANRIYEISVALGLVAVASWKRVVT